MLPAVGFPPVDGVVAVFEIRETLSDDDEQAPCAYSESNFVGRRAGGGRRHPTFGLELRNVNNRLDAGALRARNSAEAFKTDSPRGYRAVTDRLLGHTSRLCTPRKTSQRMA